MVQFRLPKQAWQETTRRNKRRMKRTREIALVAGMALWGWLVWRAGPETLLRYMEQVGWGMLTLLGIAAVRHAARSVACRWAMVDDRASFSYAEMYGILLISEAIKFVAFAGLVFGESAKGLLLSRRVSAARAVSSVVLDVALYQVSAGVFLLAGAVVLAWRGPVAPELRKILWISCGIVGAAVAVAGLGFARGWRTTRRVLQRFGGSSSPTSRWGRWVALHGQKLSEAGGQIGGFLHHHPGLFWGILIFDMAAHCASALEVLAALRLLGQPVSYAASVGVEALTKLVRISGAVIPANVGAFEGGTALVAVALGLPMTAGVALGIVRQARSVLWAGLGFLVLLVWKGKESPAKN